MGMSFGAKQTKQPVSEFADLSICAYAERHRREMPPDYSFVPGKVMPLLIDAL